MPIYEYRCPSCERVVEEVRPYHMRDVPPDCKECYSVRDMYRIVSIPAMPPSCTTEDEEGVNSQPTEV